MKRCLITVMLCTSVLLSFGQTDPEKETGSWYMFLGIHQVSDHLSINTGMQFRYYELITDYNLNLFYTGLNYKVNSNTYLTFNYGYLDIDRSIEFTDISNTIEHRFWEQVSHKHKLWNLSIHHRFRLEHRFLHNINDNSVQNRLRYRLGTNININRTLYLIANNEFFLNLEGESFRENRLYFGLGISIDENVQLQLGYLNQHINDLNLDRFQFGLYIKTDLRKKPTN